MGNEKFFGDHLAQRCPWPLPYFHRSVRQDHAAVGRHFDCGAGDFVGAAGIFDAAAETLGAMGVLLFSCHLIASRL